MTPRETSQRNSILSYYSDYYTKYGKVPSVQNALKHCKSNRVEFYAQFPGKIAEVCRLAGIPVPDERVEKMAQAKRARSSRGYEPVANSVDASKDSHALQEKRVAGMLLTGLTVPEIILDPTVTLGISEIMKVGREMLPLMNIPRKLSELKKSGIISNRPKNLFEAADELASSLRQSRKNERASRSEADRLNQEKVELGKEVDLERMKRKKVEEAHATAISERDDNRAKYQELLAVDQLLQELIEKHGLKQLRELLAMFASIEPNRRLALGIVKTISSLRGRNRQAERDVTVVYENCDRWTKEKVATLADHKMVQDLVLAATTETGRKQQEATAQLADDPQFILNVFEQAPDEVLDEVARRASQRARDRVRETIHRVELAEEERMSEEEEQTYEEHAARFEGMFRDGVMIRYQDVLRSRFPKIGFPSTKLKSQDRKSALRK